MPSGLAKGGHRARWRRARRGAPPASCFTSRTSARPTAARHSRSCGAAAAYAPGAHHRPCRLRGPGPERLAVALQARPGTHRERPGHVLRARRQRSRRRRRHAVLRAVSRPESSIWLLRHGVPLARRARRIPDALHSACTADPATAGAASRALDLHPSWPLSSSPAASSSSRTRDRRRVVPGAHAGPLVHALELLLPWLKVAGAEVHARLTSPTSTASSACRAAFENPFVGLAPGPRDRRALSLPFIWVAGPQTDARAAASAADYRTWSNSTFVSGRTQWPVAGQAAAMAYAVRQYVDLVRRTRPSTRWTTSTPTRTPRRRELVSLVRKFV